jgi:G protein-coupled receptor 107
LKRNGLNAQSCWTDTVDNEPARVQVLDVAAMARLRTPHSSFARIAVASGSRTRRQDRAAAWIVWTCLMSLARFGSALKHSFHRDNGPALIGPVGTPFGFLEGGTFDLTCSKFEIGNVPPVAAAAAQGVVEAGFLLHRFSNEAQFHQHMLELQENRTACSFEYFRTDFAKADDVLTQADDIYAGSGKITSADHGVYLPVYGPHVNRLKNPVRTVQYKFKKGEEGLYFLVFQVCPYDPSIRASIDLDVRFRNYDSFGNPSYLPAGEMMLPFLFFYFSVSYLVLLAVWSLNNRSIEKGLPGLFPNDASLSGPSDRRRQRGRGGATGQPIVYPIHRLMTALVAIKFLTTLFEAIRYHFIKVTGHAELWSVLYYLLTFVRGTFLFVVILLLGTGWSFIKPFLNPREKAVVAVVLVLQVLNNLALAVLSQVVEGERRYRQWSATLHLVDILCCCAVLIPIVWSVNALERSMGDEGGNHSALPADESEGESHRDDDHDDDDDHVDHEERDLEDGEKGQVLRKLRLFRSFYLLVVAYIYATRILVYLFATLLDYQHLWLRYMVVEIVTLAFYVTVGCMFRPMAENPYLTLKRHDRDIEMVEDMRDD